MASSTSTRPGPNVLKATLAEFPALNGQSLIYRPSLPLRHYEPPHTHPRSAELLFLVDGTLGVGFVGTKNNLFTQTLQAGDLFVFPKGSALPAQCWCTKTSSGDFCFWERKCRNCFNSQHFVHHGNWWQYIGFDLEDWCDHHSKAQGWSCSQTMMVELRKSSMCFDLLLSFMLFFLGFE